MTDTVACRICLEDTGVLISPCGCKGSTGKVHEECLKKWVAESGSEVCEICHEEYARHDIVGCNVENYCNGVFQSRISSDVEGNLINLSALHCLLAICMYSWSNMEYWMLLTSIQTVVHTLSVIMFQIYWNNLDFFVLRVLIYWSSAYFAASLVVGVIRTIDNEEECSLNCFKWSKVVGCTEDCVVYDYYNRRDTISSNVMLLRFFEVAILIFIRCIAICFTHMKRSEYYSFRRNDDDSTSTTSTTGIEEESPLLSC